ncbi:hypothetical protein ACRAKI_23985 [Saccharothrix isguenensis]
MRTTCPMSCGGSARSSAHRTGSTALGSRSAAKACGVGPVPGRPFGHSVSHAGSPVSVRGHLVEVLQRGRGGCRDVRFRGVELCPDQPDRLLVVAPPPLDQDARERDGVTSLLPVG